MTWISLGPTNIGGCMFGIAVDPTADTQLFAVSASGGCWHLRYDLYSFPNFSLSNGGEWFPQFDIETEYLGVSHWSPLTDGLPLLYMTALALCERHPQTLYCVTGHRNRAWPTQVWRSDDRGANWTQRSVPAFSVVYQLAVDPDDPERVYAATRGGLCRSIDGGSTWETLYAGVAWDVVLDPDNASVLYAGIENVGVVKTSNARPVEVGTGGLISSYPFRPFWSTVLPWSQASSPAATVIKVALGAGEPRNRTVVAKLDQEVFVSHRSGRGSWDSKGKWGGSGYVDWCHVVGADPHNSEVMLAGAENLFRSHDGGANWQQVAGYGSASHSDQQYLTFDRRQPGTAYLANDGGIWGSRDSGAKWFDLNAGLVTSELFHSGISGGAAMADMYHQGLVGTTRLQTTQWATMEGGSWEFTDVYGDPVRAGRFYVFSSKLGLRRLFRTLVPVFEASSSWPPSINMHWQEEEVGDFNVNVGDFTPRSIEFDRRSGSNTIVVGTGDGRVMRALNGDSLTPTWQAENGITGGSAVTGITFAPSRLARYWAICDSGAVFTKNDINGSGRWAASGSANNGVIDLAIGAADENRLYALHDGGLETSPDGGNNWTWINGTGSGMLPGVGLKSVFAHPNEPTLVIVGAVGGIFASTNQGASWARYDHGLPNAEIKQVFMVNGVLHATTVGRGLWKRISVLHHYSAADLIGVRIADLIRG